MKRGDLVKLEWVLVMNDLRGGQGEFVVVLNKMNWLLIYETLFTNLR